MTTANNTVTTASNVGHLVMFGSSVELWTKPDVLRAALKSEGFDASKVEDLDPVARASEAATYRIGWSDRQPVKIERLAGSKTSVAFGILYREVVQQGVEVGWKQHETVTYDVTRGWSTPKTVAGQELVRAATELWQTHYNYGWIRAEFFRILAEGGAISIGNRGGIYFCTDTSLIERIRRVVDTCRTSRPGNTTRLRTIAVSMHDREGVEAVTDAAITAITEQVQEVQDALTTWRGKAKGRASTLDKFMDELGTIRDRAVKLARALQFNMEGIEASLTAAISDVQAAMVGNAVSAGAPTVAAALVGTEAQPVTEATKTEQTEESKVVDGTPAEHLPGNEPKDQDPDPGQTYTLEYLENCKKADLVKIAKQLGIPTVAEIGGHKRPVSGVDLVKAILAQQDQPARASA